MNKKFILSFVVLALLIASGASMIALRKSGNTTINSVPRAESTDQTALVKAQPAQEQSTVLKEYSDPSGFRFMYPSNVNIVVEQDANDPDMYSSITVKSSDTDATISLKVNATNFTKLDDWLRANKISPSSAIIKRIKLGDIDAYQVPLQNQLVTAAYDQGALFVIQLSDVKNDALHTTYDKIISSFTFYQPEGAQTDQSQSTTNQNNSDSTDSGSDTEEVIQ